MSLLIKYSLVGKTNKNHDTNISNHTSCIGYWVVTIFNWRQKRKMIIYALSILGVMFGMVVFVGWVVGEDKFENGKKHKS